MFRKQGHEALANIEGGADTIVSRNAAVIGSLKTDGPVTIYGLFEGDVESTGAVIVAKSGRVNGNITGSDIAVAGTVVGNISATGKIELYNGGRVLGDIISSNLKIEDGALFSGQSSMKLPFTETLLLQSPKELEQVEE